MDKKILRFALLSASLLVGSAAAINANIPAMAQHFDQVPLSMVEMLTTVPSLFLMISVLTSSLIAKRVGYKQTITIGLGIVMIAGIVPLLIDNFMIILISRAMLGFGVGLFNSLLVSMINYFYDAKERSSMYGLQSAFEGAGGIAITFIAGQLLKINWQAPFIAYMLSLIHILYKPMINHIVDELKQVGVDEIYVIVGHKAEEVEKLLDGVNIIYQKEQLGTGHALMQCKDALAGKAGTTVVLNGDAPLITSETLKDLIAYHNDNQLKGTIMTCDCDLDKKFGRVIRNNDQVTGIVEFKDCTPEQVQISEMNCGEYCFDNIAVFEALEKVTNDNAQNEYYITDVIEIMNNDKLKVGGYKIADLAEVGGINDRVELAEATKSLQLKINKQHLLNGVNIIDINNTYIGVDVTIGADTTIEPGCIIKGKSSIGRDVYKRQIH